MSQLVLPQTIDAGTALSAAEVQSMFVATRDIINGQLEGGTGVNSNVKAKGLTIRESDANMAKYIGTTATLKPGVEVYTDLALTPGAGLQVSYAAGRAFITDDGTVHTSGVLLPGNVASGSTLTFAANASGNPRIDTVVATLTAPDTAVVSILQGTATVGATLANPVGRATLGTPRVALWDVLVPTGFAGPFVATTHFRNRRTFAKPQDIVLAAVASVDIPVDTSADYLLKLTYTIDTSAFASVAGFPDGDASSIYSHVRDGSNAIGTPAFAAVAATGAVNNNNGMLMGTTPSAGQAVGTDRYVGEMLLNLQGTGKVGRAHVAVSQTSGAGNEVAEIQQIATNTSKTTFSFLRIQPGGGGTLTGYIRAERF